MSKPLVDAVSERLNDAAPRGIKIQMRLLGTDSIEVVVHQRWRTGWSRGRVGGEAETTREVLIDAIDLAAQQISFRHGRQWPPGATTDDEPHLAIEGDSVRIWFGESRWPLLTLDPIPLSLLPPS